MHRKVAAALVAALALGVASCGSGGSEEKLTRAQLVSRIEQACRDGQREAERQMRASRTEGDSSTFIQAILAGQKVQLDAAGDFDVPAAAEADYEAFKAGVQARVDAVERAASADRADLQRAIAAVQPEAEAAARKIDAAARRLGAEGCS